jgi:hypothetical protein
MPDRIRMTCAVSAVLGGIAAAELYGDVTVEEVARRVREVVADLYPA